MEGDGFNAASLADDFRQGIGLFRWAFLFLLLLHDSIFGTAARRPDAGECLQQTCAGRLPRYAA